MMRVTTFFVMKFLQLRLASNSQVDIIEYTYERISRN